ncbi:cyclin-D3-1 [Argentina anserina]|uniref:cyclin-D3-1 n=1 Tax=Argentina anserina TaxID=57926 RepID=UPI00217672F9|nr:cyclin-D3-1 [Potentilla anserina]
MAMNQNEPLNEQSNSFLLDDALFCGEEEKWEEEDEVSEVYNGDDDEINNSNDYSVNGKTQNNNPSLFPLLLLEQDLFWEDEELLSLFVKEQQQPRTHLNDAALVACRREAVGWMLKVNAHYGFTALTAILAVNYFDRFICSVHFQRDKPWMVQLVSVACISVAAKVEETEVPLLLDLQVEDTKYVFEAKTVQRMELLVLSTLQWRMHPVTPISFLDHIIRRLGLKTTLHWEFLKRCESVLLSLVLDSRCIGYLPSVLATATMMRVIELVEPCKAVAYQTQLLGVLKISKEKVNDCYTLILEMSNYGCKNNNPLKRKHEQIPGSPNGVIDAYFSSDSSNDSWAAGSSVSLSPEPQFKKIRAEASSLNRLMGIVGSP